MDPLRRTARRRPDAPALDTAGAIWSYGKLEAAASAVGRAVADAGVPPGGRVALLLPRGLAAVAALHGVARAGAAVAPLHQGWTEGELSAHLGLVDPDLVLASEATLERARALVGQVPVRSLEPEELARGASGPAADASTGAEVRGPAAGRSSEAPASGGGPGTHTILATSGTSGRPRAVRLTLENHVACARGAASRLELSPEDRWLASLSLAHVGGVAMVMRAAVTEACLVLDGDFDAGRFHELVDRGDVTHASLVPTMLRRVVEGRKARGGGEARSFPDSLRGVLVGGDAADPDLVDRALDLGMPVHLTYGLTEAASQVATGTPRLARRKPEAVGPPLPGVKLRIGDGGEILVAGPTVTPGLLPEGRPEDRFVDGWLRTGDAGRLDDEGHLHVVGRLSSRIVTGGVTVDPAVVEAVLVRHPSVREAVVVGVADPEWGERVAAVVASVGQPPSAEELRSFCRGDLSGPRLPRRFRFVESIPRNPNGKPDRSEARRLLEA